MQSIHREGHVLVNLYQDELDQLTTEAKAKINAFFRCIYCKKKILGCDCNAASVRAAIKNPSRETAEDIYHLHCLREDKSSGMEGYLGTYSVSHRDWEEIYDEIRRGNRLVRDRKKSIARAFAASFNFETSKIKDAGMWLKKHYPKHSFALKQVAIPWKEEPSQLKNQKRLRPIYESAFKKTDSDQHAKLKWIGWNWLCEKGGQIRDGYGNPTQFRNGRCVYEQRLFFTSKPRRIRYVASDGSGRYTYVRSGKMQDNKKPWLFERGDVLVVADVFGYGISVECGVTKAESLVLPLIHEVCEMTLWIPFFKELNRNGNDGRSEVTAFSIRLEKFTQKDWADIVV